MVNLSASRRNSSISSNSPKTYSPRPSLASSAMPSLDENRNEKSVKFTLDTSSIDGAVLSRTLKPVTPGDRCDSGFHEDVVHENGYKGTNGSSGGVVPPQVLRRKLEEIVENRQEEPTHKILQKEILKSNPKPKDDKSNFDKMRSSYLSKIEDKTPNHRSLQTPKLEICPKFMSRNQESIHNLQSKNPYSFLKSPIKIPHEPPKTPEIISPLKTTSTISQSTPTWRSSYTPKKLNIQPNSKTALLRQKFEKAAEEQSQSKMVKNFRTK